MMRIIDVAVIFLVLLPHTVSAAERIRIGYSGLSPATGMLWVTHEGKLFEKNGLTPDVLFLRNNLGQSALIAGEIEMCGYSASLLAPARVQGADPLMIVSFQRKLNYRLVVRPEIRTLADLKGKVLGVTRYGTVNDSTMRLLLNKLGVNPERDVRLIQVGDSAPAVATALIAGKTFDGALLQPPFTTKRWTPVCACLPTWKKWIFHSNRPGSTPRRATSRKVPTSCAAWSSR